MRIAIVNRHDRIVGGAEQYLAATLGPMTAGGHEVSLWCEEPRAEQLDERTPINCPTHHVAWSGESGREQLLDQLAAYEADVVCVHSPLDFDIEDALLARYPSIFFGHAYALTCISGGKTLHGLTDRPCGRVLGPGCLLHYYPHRCGGLNPVTMTRNYLLNQRRREHLQRYSAIVTFSNHMVAEYVRHGLPVDRVSLIPPLVTGPASSGPTADPHLRAAAAANSRFPGASAGRVELSHIGFLGRLEIQKGAELLIRALPLAARALGRRLTLSVAGAGSEATRLQKVADLVTGECDLVSIQFDKWVEDLALDSFYSGLDLLVVPSIWPEPFGLVGLEASARGVPVAAFEVGGIPDWLHEGINGHLAPADRPTAGGLARAMTECLRDREHHSELRQGGLRVAGWFSTEKHLAALTALLRQVADEGRRA